MWQGFGFRKSLYDTHPVRGDDQGERLLVGRDQELRKLTNRIDNQDLVVSLEGPNGVGKTSLVLVAGYQLERDTAERGKGALILIPEPFQFTAEDTAVDFKRKVYASIASHFIANEADYRIRLDLQFNLRPLSAWLENPIFQNGSVSVAGFGAGGGRTANVSAGFDLHGFFSIVDRLLASAFSDRGGVICVLDNLEILNTSDAARQKLESLRDDLLSKHGIKWVVCGARGIVRSVAASPRLQGRLSDPLDILPLQSDSINQLISSRVSEYELTSNSIPPVGVKSFSHIFDVLHANLRDALKFSGDFSLWLYENESYKPDTEELHQLFEIWLTQQSDLYFESIHVPPRAWRLLDAICSRGGSISPSDFEDFDFSSSAHMRGSVAQLEEAAIVTSERADTDHRRKTINVMAKGWLLQYHRSGYSSRG